MTYSKVTASKTWLHLYSFYLQATKFPHDNLGADATLGQLIIRDADISQAFGPTWIGDITAGYGSELGKSPNEMLKMQLGFLGSIRFHTDFGREMFGDAAIEAKLEETKNLLDILES